jgi:cell division protein FtsI/penicillin-binding protein 2
MANAYSIIANGGIYIKPKIIDEINYPNNKKIIYSSEPQRRVITKETSEIVSKMLASSLKDGVAKNGYIPGYTLA